MRRCRFLFFIPMIFLTPMAEAATLTVEITGLASNNGDVHIALYDNPEVFPNSDGMIVERKVMVMDMRTVATFPDLTAGEYAIAVYHDENANHDFDQGLLGIPLEDYGFSSGAVAFFGPPSFKDAAFKLAEPATNIRIDLGN